MLDGWAEARWPRVAERVEFLHQPRLCSQFSFVL